MSNYTKDDALLELKKLREHLLTVVNTTVDALIDRLESGEDIDTGLPCETVYPLSITPALFKGKKPTAVIFGEERVEVKKWKAAYTEILRRCARDPDAHAMLIGLRNKIHGRSRTILADKPDGMNKPVQAAEGIFAESFFDTEWLIRILTTEILDAAGYDYSGISIAIVQGKRG